MEQADLLLELAAKRTQLASLSEELDRLAGDMHVLPLLRLGLCGAHSFETPQVNPGSLYRCGNST